MPFGSKGFSGKPLKSFDSGLSKGFEEVSKTTLPEFFLDENPFKFTPKDSKYRSNIRFYDQDALWTRWRRGYELYTVTQNVLGSFSQERAQRGDYRMYCSFQQFPGVFIPIRVFTFPTTNSELGNQLVGIRDANSLNFYNFGLPILEVRYLGTARSATYSQVSTTITVSKQDHGFFVGENVYLVFTSGAGVNATLPITSTTQNSFTCIAAAPLSTGGNLTIQLSTIFTDSRWTELRTKLRSLPTAASFLSGERLVDRVIEKDPGISATYSRAGSTLTVTCSSVHGLSTGNTVYLSISSGLITSGQYTITVTSVTQFTITTITSGATSGNATVIRLIMGFRYDDYVGYTVNTVDATTNEIVFYRTDSYAAQTINNKTETVVPAARGFEVGRFLTTEVRYQCTCQDYTRRSGYNFFKEGMHKNFPVTAIGSTKPGQYLDKDGSLINQRDNVGVFSDLGHVAINNFYQLPTYEDTSDTSFPNLMYYQLRWCKHIYAAMFSLNHDEGNSPLSIDAKYVQSGVSITITAENHGLQANTKVELVFTSGSASSGQYTITQIIDSNSFKIVYPFSNNTSGYCIVENLKEHDYVKVWLLEPNDKPVGDSLDAFYISFDKENKNLRKAAERFALVKQGEKWVGTQSVIGSRNLPEDIANIDPQLLVMLMTDEVRRGSSGTLDNQGVLQNSTQRMISMISKLLNLQPEFILGTKFAMLDEPLINYMPTFDAGAIRGGAYLNGAPTEDLATLTSINCSSYDPYVQQDTVVSSGRYINS